MSPKERVRANIYRELLEQEKRRNKKLSIFSVGVFVLGVFATSSYNNYRNNLTNTSPNFVLTEKRNHEFEKDSFIFDSIYNAGILSEKKTVTINPDQLFGLDTQI